MVHEGNRIELFRLKCHKTCVALEERLNEDLPVLLSRECECAIPSYHFQSTQEVSSGFGRPEDFWAHLHIDHMQRRIPLVVHFPFPVGVTFSGLLLVMPEGRIRERFEERSATQDDLDVLYEVCNQLRSVFMRSLRKVVHQDVHPDLDHVLQGNGTVEGFSGPVVLTVPVRLRIPRLLSDRFEIISDASGFASLLGVPLETEEILQLVEEEASSGEEKSDASLSPASSAVGRAVIVEGSPEGQRLAGILRGLGFHIVKFGSVGELTQLLQGGEIDVVLIDSGEDLSKAIRLAQMLRSFSRECKILVGANGWRKEQLFQGVRAGVSGFLVKPYDAETLREKLLGQQTANSQKAQETTVET